MFGIDRKSLMENLEKIREQRCAYFIDLKNDFVCDCKFGKKDELPNNKNQESFSGCAEIRQTIEILRFVTDEEYLKICCRGGVVL